MQETNVKKYGVKNVASLPEVRDKMKKTMSERYGVNHYNQLPEMKKYLRENCREWLSESYKNPWAKGITRPKEWNEKQSVSMNNLIESGQWKGGGNNTYKGTYDSTKCIRGKSIYRSGYELQTHVHLDNDENVEFYDYEPFQIPYYDTEDHKRYYTIDFIIKYKSGGLLAVEVKNNYTKEEFLNHNKYKAAKSLFEEEKIEFEIWTNDKIESLGLTLSDLLEDDRVNSISVPKTKTEIT